MSFASSSRGIKGFFRRNPPRPQLQLESLEQRYLLAGDTFFSGLMDFNGSVAGGSLIEMGRFEGQSAGGATYNNQWTARTGNTPANGNLVTTVGVIPLFSATNSDGTSFFPAGRIVAVYASQSEAVEAGGAPAGLATDLDPSAVVDAALSPTGAPIQSAGVFKIYDRGPNPGPLNAADATTWVPNFGNLSEGIIGELIVDGRADMASASGRFYDQGLPTDLTALPIIDVGEQDLVNVSVVDPNGAFQGLRTDIKALLNREMVGNQDDFFKNPQTIPDPAELPPGFVDWDKTSSTFPLYGEDDLLLRFEEIVNAAGFPQPDTVGLQDFETLFDFLLDMHPSEDPATLHRFQDVGAADGDAYVVTGLTQQSATSLATTGDVVFDNTGGIGFPGAQFTPVPAEPPAMLGDFVWEDLNANGIQDPDELDDGINGVTVKLLTDPDGDGNFDTIDATMVTSNNPDTGLPGWYKFNDLTPGVEYVVMFNNPDPDGPDAYMFSPREVGGDPAVDSDGPMSDPVVLAPGEFNPTLDAGFFRKGSIHVFGFLDVNGNGLYEPGGDFNSDGIYDKEDIDSLVAEIAAGTHNPHYDLNGDGVVDLRDRDSWLSAAGQVNMGPGLHYLLGDSNLDGVVDVQDLNIWNTNKFSLSTRWSLGNFSADNSVGVSDFNLWNSNKFTTSWEFPTEGINFGDTPFPDDPGKTFDLLDENGDVIDTQITMDGMAWFEQLLPGTYTVRENPIPTGYELTTLPNARTFTIISGQELVYEDGAAMLPDGDQRFETNLGDELRWGNTELAMIGDYVWDDKNANGIQDPVDVDRGINGALVKLLADTNDDGVPDTQVDQTVTADNPDNGLPGFYKFNGLRPGVAYQVMFVNPDTEGPDAYMVSPFQADGDPDSGVNSDANPADNLMSDVVVLDSGEFNDTIDAGFFRKGSIHVFGFLDEDGDGFQDDNEGAFPNDPGKTFELLDENGNVIETQITMDGMAWFVQLVPGEYTVRENPIPDGYSLTTLPNARTFTVMSGVELVYEEGAAMLGGDDERTEMILGDELKWGNTELAMIGDYVWDDKNANGIQDPVDVDRGINGAIVKLLADTNDDGVPDTQVDQTVTADNPDNGLPGFYKFNGLTPGVAYQVMFVNPDTEGLDAYMVSPFQADGDPNSGVNSDANPADNLMSDVVVLDSGEFNDTIDAGFFRKGSIHVFGFLDEDGDGIQDDNEAAFPNIPGKTFELLDENGNVIETQITMDGMAWFVQLVPGEYTVRENPIPDGYSLTTLPNARTFTVMSGVELVYEEGAAMLDSDDERTEMILGDELKWGNTELAMIGDYVWDDKNANGIQDPVDVDRGINGAIVKLLADTNDDGVPDTQVDQTVTADNPDNGLPGFYKFNGLTPGVAYQVMFVNPDTEGLDAYMVSPFQADGDPNSGVNSDANPADNLMSDVVVLDSGEFNDTIDAGFFRKGSIHVFGFLDEDGDGIQDDNEGAFPNIPGKTFELLDENGNVIETQITMDGMAWFVQLVPGEYTVRENPIPDGYSLTTLPNARTFTVMSGVELVYEEGAAMLGADDERTEMILGDELKWGNTELAMIGDYVWDDKNANGIQDPEDFDRGINGALVKLLADTNDDGVPDTQVDQTVTADNPDNGLPGFYKFNGLTPGVAYQVMFVNPDTEGPDAYMVSPFQADGDPDSGVNSDANPADNLMSDVVVLDSGEFNDTIDAGFFRKGSIHVFGFLDEDGDGFQDDNEGAFPNDPGKTFELLDENGNVIETQITMDGMAWFVQLIPGEYTVRENPIPDGFSLTTLPNQRTFTVMSGVELVYEDGAAMLDPDDERTEMNLGDDLKWGNAPPDVRAKIEIVPDDTNEVGDSHTFTVIVMADDGLPAGTPGGDAFDGFGPAVGSEVTVSLDGINGAVPDLILPSNLPPMDPTIVVGVTDASGEFDVTFTSANAGQVLGSASSTVDVRGQMITVATDGTGLNSGPATKTFVDAKIIIAPDDTNEVGDPHTFTATVFVDDGTGTDADGEMGTFDRVLGASVVGSLTGLNGAQPIPVGPFFGQTDGNGEFDITFTSNSAGQVMGMATTTVIVDGVPLIRVTDGSAVGGGQSNSGPAIKTFVDAKIIIAPDDTNEVGDPHTFTTTVFVDDGTGTDVDGVMGTFDAVGAGVPVTVGLTNQNGAAANPAGPFNGNTDANGHFDVTFTSPNAGQVIGSATTTVVVGGVSLTRVTDGSAVGGGQSNSGPATKTFVDAKIIITPDDDTNEVGDPHTFTATVFVDDGTGTDLDGVMGTFDAVGAGVPVTVGLTSQNGAVANPAGPFNGNTNANGQFDVIFTSPNAGQVIGTATTTVVVGGVSLTRSTDGSPVGGGQSNSDPASKTFVDAKIVIGPDGVNPVNAPHTFTTTVFVDDGTGTDLDGVMGTFDAVGAGVPVTVTLTNQNGAVASPPGPFNGNTNGSGQFDVTFTSATPGDVIGNATTTVVVGGVPLTRTTDGSAVGGGQSNSGPATKTFVSVDAKIIIEPDDTNEVGDDHTFIVTVFEDDGTMTDIDGEMGFFDRAPGETVTVMLTDFFGAMNMPSTPLMGVTDANGEFRVTFTSDSAGQVVGSAFSSVQVAGQSLPRETDGIAPNSGPATKTFVDAKIIIDPDDTNEVGDPHTFTTTVFVDDGTGTDTDGVMGTFDAVGAGVPVTVTLASQNGAAANPAGPFNGNTDVNGQFDVTFTSPDAGQVIGTATTTVVVDGVPLTRTTDGSAVGGGKSNSGPAIKTFVDAKVVIVPQDDTNEVGDPHTFTVIVFVDDGTGTDTDGEMGTFDRVQGASVFTALTGMNGAEPIPVGPFVGPTDANGEFDVTFTSNSAGQVMGTATTTVVVDGVALVRVTDGSVVGGGQFNSGPATKTFVDAKIIIAPDDTNEVGDPHTFTATVFVDDGSGTDTDGVMGTFDAVGAGVPVTVGLTNQNGAAANPAGPFNGNTDANGQFDVTFTSPNAGQVIGSASTTVVVGGLPLTRTTDGSAVGGGQSNSGPATKTFVDAKIIITPNDDTNEVDDPHTFTATVFVDDGAGTDADGVMGTFDAVGAGVPVTVGLTNQNGAAANPAGPFNGITNASGQFDVTFTSPDAGQVIGTATTTVVVGGVPLTRTTDGSAVGGGQSNSGPANKTFVDAKIIIGPDGVNPINAPHTFTTTVFVDDGTGTDLDGVMGTFDAVGAGVPVTVTLTNQNGAVASPPGPFNGNTNGGGQFDVTFTSATPGDVIGNATTTVVVGGVPLTRTTDGSAVGGGQSNSGPATKTFIGDPEIDLEKFTRVDVNPIDIEKLVRVEGLGVVGDVCDVLGKPVALTFTYLNPDPPVIDTNQKPGQVEFVGSAFADNDDEAYIVVGGFAGTVTVGESFVVNESGGDLTIEIFDFFGGPLLQEISKYHLSCSQAITLGDVLGGITLTGYVGENGASQPPDFGPGVGDDDADLPTGPSASPGDTVVFTYVVTNPIEDSQLADVVVTDQVLAPEVGNVFNPDPVLDNGFNVGDTDRDNRLDFGEEWLYTSTTEITNDSVLGQYTDKATVLGTPVDDNGMQIGAEAMDMDPANFVAIEEPPIVGDVCDILGNPVAITFQYIPGDTVDTAQDSGKAEIIFDSGMVDNDGVSFVVVSDESDASKARAGDGKQFFRGNVAIDATFEANENIDSFGSTTFVYFFDNQSGGLLQSVEYHTSCSQPIQLGDVIGNATLVGYAGEDGSASLPPPPDSEPIDLGLGDVFFAVDQPFDPNNIGEDADSPTGPLAQLGDKVTFTYKVTNTGSLDLVIDELFDDNETPGVPEDDFMPAPVLVNGFNFGDSNMDNVLNPGEMWYFQAMRRAFVPGQHRNVGKVKATSEFDDMVMDDDPSHHLVNPINLEKLVRAAGPPVSGDVCDTLGDPVQLTFSYDPSNTFNPLQDVPGKAEIIVNNGPDNDDTGFVIVSDSDSNPLSGDVFFQGSVTSGETFTAAGNFSSNTYIYFYDFQGGPLLQEVKYHTSCSAPIILGAQVLSGTLVGYVGENGTADPPDPGPGVNDDDADEPRGPNIMIGSDALFTYVVTNLAATPNPAPIANVVVVDDNETPGDPSDDFNPDPVLDMDGFNVGDTNQNDLLEPGEEWLYVAMRPVNEVGQHTNVGKVTGDVLGTMVMDDDPANFFGNSGDVCDTLGNPEELTFQYLPSTMVDTDQDSGKAEILFDSGMVDNDGVSFIVVTDESDPAKALDADGKQFFRGNVAIDGTFEANEDTDSFGSTTYIHFFDSQSGGLLQSVEYHTSCSQPIRLGDVIGNATLVGYVGEDGALPGSPIVPPDGNRGLPLFGSLVTSALSSGNLNIAATDRALAVALPAAVNNAEPDPRLRSAADAWERLRRFDETTASRGKSLEDVDAVFANLSDLV